MRLRHDFLKNDVAADAGEAEIEDDGGGFFLIESVQRVERILRFFGVEAGQCENRGKHPAQIVVVFHDQDFLAHMRTLAEFLPSRKLRRAWGGAAQPSAFRFAVNTTSTVECGDRVNRYKGA